MMKLNKNELNSIFKECYYDTIENISKQDSSKSLIKSSHRLINFDKFCANYFDENCLPYSADALFIINNSIVFIEFKSGFKRQITKSNYDLSLMICHKTLAECEEYKTIFFKILN